MTATVDYLPIWKKDSSAEEWFMECAAVARKHPERFDKVAIIYQEKLKNDNTLDRYWCRNTTTTELMGLLELGKGVVIKDCQA